MSPFDPPAAIATRTGPWPPGAAPRVGEQPPLSFAPWEDSRSAALRSLLDAMPMPIVLLSAQRAWLGANRAAGATLARCLAVCDGRVGGFAVPASDSFESLFRLAASGREASAVIRPPHGTPICRVRLAPVTASVWLNTAYAQAAVLLCLDGGTGRGELGPIARLFRLTAQELRVLALVAEGLAPRQIAEQLAVAVCTVRSHLQALYQKTGAARQADLVRLVVALI